MVEEKENKKKVQNQKENKFRKTNQPEKIKKTRALTSKNTSKETVCA